MSTATRYASRTEAFIEGRNCSYKPLDRGFAQRLVTGGAVSPLTGSITQAKSKDLQLGSDLVRELKLRSSRQPFGLDFERHRTEAGERGCTRKGDKRF